MIRTLHWSPMCLIPLYPGYIDPSKNGLHISGWIVASMLLAGCVLQLGYEYWRWSKDERGRSE